MSFLSVPENKWLRALVAMLIIAAFTIYMVEMIPVWMRLGG